MAMVGEMGYDMLGIGILASDCFEDVSQDGGDFHRPLT